MHFAPTPEQTLACEALRELLQAHCSAAQLREVFEAESVVRVPGLWRRLVELGVIGALAPEAAGGVGLSDVDLCLLLVETGRAAVPELVLETAAVAVPLLAALPEDARARCWLERILQGEVCVALAFGDGAESDCTTRDGIANAPKTRRGTPELKGPRRVSAEHILLPWRAATCLRRPDECLPLAEGEWVAGAESAELILLERRGELHVCDAQHARIAAIPSVDGARRIAHVELELEPDTCLVRGAMARQLLAAARDRAALGAAAQLVGLGARMLELTTDHVKTRKQFGQPVGAFQAVKHQLVDAHLAVEFAAPLVYRAALSLSAADPARSLHVSMAKAAASDAALLAARKALQLHGAIGYSYEYALQLYMKRAWALAASYGDAREHRLRIEQVVLAEPGETHG